MFCNKKMGDDGSWARVGFWDAKSWKCDVFARGWAGEAARAQRRATPAIYNHRVRILISAGEASGEMYGAQLIEALHRLDPSLEFFGVGGDRMRAAGCDTVFDAKELAVVGITEILSHLPKIWGLFGKLVAEADHRKPDLAIVIDAPAFNWRVARAMRKRGVPVVYYVCPQFWAWRQGRVKLLCKYVTKALAIFPFEEQFFRERGVDTTFVGHPLAGLPVPTIAREDYAQQHQLDPAKLWITLMPGSRRKEVAMNLPTILASAAQLGPGHEFLLPVAPTLDPSLLALLAHTVPALNDSLHLVPDSLPALRHSRAGIIASGTATVEAALMNTPFVMVYRVSPMTYLLGRSQVKVPYFAMVNLIAGTAIVPELVQDDFTVENIVRHLRTLLSEGPERQTMLAGLTRVQALLEGPVGTQPAPERAAAIIHSILRNAA
jgi:lipid-A-disaccharide synthase